VRTATVQITGVSPYSSNAFIRTPKKDKEGHDKYEERTWKERANVNNKGEWFIPPMAFYHSICDASAFRGDKLKGAKTFTKRFISGVLCVDPVPLGVQLDDIQGEWLPVPSDGKRGGGSRVWKCFPIVHEWTGIVAYQVADDMINEDIFRKTITDAGKFVGVGRFRPQNRGYYGRFQVDEIEWSNGA
jgi:hypothetical protein